MNIENEIISYLYEYGNTREVDLIKYGVDQFHSTPKKMKRALRRMSVKGRIYFIVHNRLEPPEVYISLEAPLPPKTTRILMEVLGQMKTVENDVRKILKEAAAVSERTTSRK